MNKMTGKQAIEWLKKNLSSVYSLITDALEENEKLKAENKKLETELAEMIFDEDKLNNQMSAVEVLKLMKEIYFKDNTMEILFGTYDWEKIFKDFTPQEIVDKITEYEKNNSNSDEGTKKGSEKFEFKVGDLVKVNRGHCTGTVDKIRYIDYRAELCTLDHGLCVELDNIEHAEPPKEEPQVEWVWECYLTDDFNDNLIIKCCEKSEKSAIKVCEKLANENDWKMFYRKVCRRKE